MGLTALLMKRKRTSAYSSRDCMSAGNFSARTAVLIPHRLARASE